MTEREQSATLDEEALHRASLELQGHFWREGSMYGIKACEEIARIAIVAYGRSTPFATVDQHEEAWAKIHDLLAAGHWSRARAIFDQATSAERDKIIEECAVITECASPNDGMDHSSCPFCCTAKEVRALKNAAPQEPSGKSPGTVGNDGYEQKAPRGAPVRDVPAVAAPITISATASAWIPISERMPLHQQVVIVPGGIGYWNHEMGDWYTLTAFEWPGRPIQWEVKHWMPMPIAPEGYEAVK